MGRYVADVVVVIHFAFVLFVVFGGLGVLRYRGIAWIHVPAVLWAGTVEIMGWICPLTPLENRLRAQAGEPGYTGGFVDHSLIPVLYPEDLTREIQWGLGVAVLGINLGIYAWIFWRSTKVV